MPPCTSTTASRTLSGPHRHRDPRLQRRLRPLRRTDRHRRRKLGLVREHSVRVQAGTRTDGDALVKFGLRWYLPTVGTWTQRDTLDAPLDPGNANRYAYAGDDPFNDSDPSGTLRVKSYNDNILSVVYFYRIETRNLAILEIDGVSLGGFAAAGVWQRAGLLLDRSRFRRIVRRGEYRSSSWRMCSGQLRAQRLSPKHRALLGDLV
ncbi:RHS repeat-associated core domain-containing protein [Curtobacterium sp. RRHDQ10]|uniref:RHS repeat-associated core domain-containing protein n=1 Tax=Curtobacterium phyllosphaerae TaxID=3413379 RepID=UPI003BF169BD